MQRNLTGTQWSSLRIEDMSVYLVQFTVCYNPSECVLTTLQCAPVETGQTSEERIAVVKTHQGISRQDSSD